MRFLRIIKGKTRRDRIKNKIIEEKLIWFEEYMKQKCKVRERPGENVE